MSMKLRPLLEVLADGNFHSAESIGVALASSRTAVRKWIDKLRALGVEIQSVAGKGYRIPAPVSLLDKSTILELLGSDAERWSSKIDVAFSTSSTNRDALLSAKQGLDVMIHVAEHQSEGRGRRGKSWLSPLGGSIYFSMLTSLRSGVVALDGLSLAVAVLVVSVLNDAGFAGFGLKWPNDILLDGKKLAGILLEISGDVAGPSKVIIGIGINVQLPGAIKSEMDQPVTDLAEKFGVPPDRNLLVARLINTLTKGISLFEREGFSAFRARWQELDYYRGRHVKVLMGADSVAGLVEGIDDQGALLVRTVDGMKAICSGELFPSMRAL